MTTYPSGYGVRFEFVLLFQWSQVSDALWARRFKSCSCRIFSITPYCNSLILHSFSIQRRSHSINQSYSFTPPVFGTFNKRNFIENIYNSTWYVQRDIATEPKRVSRRIDRNQRTSPPHPSPIEAKAIFFSALWRSRYPRPTPVLEAGKSSSRCF